MTSPSSGGRFLEPHHEQVADTNLNRQRGKSQFLGILERCSVGPQVEELQYKLMVVGPGGVGKSFFISWLAGLPLQEQYYSTPGVNTTNICCPHRLLVAPQKMVLFSLKFFEIGSVAKRSVSEENLTEMDCIIPMFDFTEKGSLQLVQKEIEKFSANEKHKPCFVSVGSRWDLQEPMIINQQDIALFEKTQKVPIIKVPQISSENMWLSEKSAILTFLCEQLYLRDQALLTHCPV